MTCGLSNLRLRKKQGREEAGETRERRIQFPLDQGFDVVEAHGRALVPGAKGIQSRAIAILVQAGERLLAGFGCEGGVSERAVFFFLFRRAWIPWFGDWTSDQGRRGQGCHAMP